MDHADWEVDDAIFVVFTISIALMIFAWRRMRDLGREIKARMLAEDTARKLARHDPLTGLPNRRFFNEKLDEALHNVIADGRRAAVLMLDLDGFKPINDVYGHMVGDKALIEFTERITAAAKGALVARVGGDEFSIVMPKINSLDEPAGLARRISKAVAEPFQIAGTETALGVGIGIGIAVAPDDGTTADELVHLDGDRIIGFEALARWNSPVLGTVFPNVFIAVAEECGLIHRLGDQLLRTACRDAMNWPDDFTLAFNISPVQLRDATLGLRVLGILGETGFPPARPELEITESAIVGDALLAQRMIDELRAAGVRIALDDFGTGYATMSQLLAFRFDKIKIDRSFVNNLGTDGDSEVIVRAIIGLAKGLGLTTTAEGIETGVQLADLKAGGCIEGQGYLFGKAIPAVQIPDLLRQPSISAEVA
jgi:diguanylate cyclase (GGDEF)-like protein